MVVLVPIKGIDCIKEWSHIVSSWLSDPKATLRTPLHCLRSLYLTPLSLQVRAGLEKAKQALEKESSDLSADLRSLTSAKQDVEHKKKKVEGQLNELHSRFNESERQRTELGERVSKMTVSDQNDAEAPLVTSQRLFIH